MRPRVGGGPRVEEAEDRQGSQELCVLSEFTRGLAPPPPYQSPFLPTVPTAIADGRARPSRASFGSCWAIVPDETLRERDPSISHFS